MVEKWKSGHLKIDGVKTERYFESRLDSQQLIFFKTSQDSVFLHLKTNNFNRWYIKV